MRFLFLLLAAMTLGAAEATPASDGFNEALADNELVNAARALDRLMKERSPADGRPDVDSLVAARLGRLEAAGGNYAQAAALLRTVDFTQLPAAERPASLLAFARSLEATGEREEALAAYRLLTTESVPASSELQDALLGLARMTMLTDPQAALSMLSAADAPRTWETLLLQAQAALLAGQAATAIALADRAWVQAIQAPPRDFAPLNVALVRAGLFAARGDRDREIAMLSAANAQLAEVISSAMVQLPVCGDKGLRRDDWVIMGVAANAAHGDWLIPVAASRPEALAPFFERFAGLPLLSDRGDPGPRGTVITLSCAMGGSYTAPTTARLDPFQSFLAERGLYPALLPGFYGDEAITELSRRIEASEARYGANSVMLLPLRMQMLGLLQMKSAAGEPVAAGGTLDLSREISDGLRAAGAPEGFAEALRYGVEYGYLYRQAALGRADTPTLEEGARKFLMAMPFENAWAWTMEAFRTAPPEAAPVKARLITALARRVPADLDSGDRKLWLRDLAAAQIAGGMMEEARATLREGGMTRSLCMLMDSEPQLLEQTFTPENFPPDMIEMGQSGVSVLEFSLTSDGRAYEPRLLVSAPSGLFDQVTRQDVAGIRYTAPTRDGEAVRCTGMVQPVRWLLPSVDRRTPPTIVAPEPADTI